MRPQYQISTEPAIDPVSIDEALEHVRVDSADDIEYVRSLIPVARQFIENQTCKVAYRTSFTLTAATWEDLFRDYPQPDRPAPSVVDPRYGVTGVQSPYSIPLFRYPLSSVTSVKYYAPDAVALTTISDSDYNVVTAAEPGIIQLDAAPPAVDDRVDAIQIIFVAGSDDPAPTLKHAILMMVAHLYENRLPIAIGNIVNEIPFTINALMTHQKESGFF